MSGNLIRCQNGHLFQAGDMEQCVRTAILRQPRKKKVSGKSQEEIEDILFWRRRIRSAAGLYA